MIALLVGHCKKYPGSTANPTHSEYYYNTRFAQTVRKVWQELKFFQGLIFDVGDNDSDSKGGNIIEREELCIKAKVKFAFEIHHNAGDDDYASTYSKKGDQLGKDLSVFLRGYLEGCLQEYGCKQWEEVELPDPDYGHKYIVEDTPFPCVILEPLFLDYPYHQPYFNDPNEMAKVATMTARAMYHFYEVRYGTKKAIL